MCGLGRFGRVRLCHPMDCMSPSSLLCPWDPPGKNIGVGCHFLLQGIFPTQGSNKCLRSPASADGFFTTRNHLGSPLVWTRLLISLPYLPRRGIAWSCVRCVCKFLTTCQSMVQSGRSMFHSSLGVLRFPMALCALQHLVRC